MKLKRYGKAGTPFRGLLRSEKAARSLSLEKWGGRDSEAPELFFAFVGPVGTNLPIVEGVLVDELRAAAYQTVSVRMSQLLKEVRDFAEPLNAADRSSTEQRIKAYMDCGDELRKRAANGDALAQLATVYVRAQRQGSHRQAFIFNSLKHPEEVKTLRGIYGEGLVVISIYSPRERRSAALTQQIAKSRKAYPSTRDQQEAEALIDRDAQDPKTEFGQNVADTFPLADFFLREGPRDEIQGQLRRLVEIVFQHPYRTPTREEYGMFQARAAALRSADLSRQVGASICAVDGTTLVSGCNEVPKAGGGTYWEGDRPDYRDFLHGSDANALLKRDLLRQVLLQLQEAGCFRVQAGSSRRLAR